MNIVIYFFIFNKFPLDELGNEEFLPGYEIDGLDVFPQFGGGGIEAPTPEACQTECSVRPDFCDGWTFIEGQAPSCFLKCKKK